MHRRRGSLSVVSTWVLALIATTAVCRADDAAIRPIKPLSDDGKPLNLDFETGTLRDWTAVGNAFTGQPVRGDAVNTRRPDMHARQQGDYWIGGFELAGDEATGTLTSVPFTVSHRWASFLMAGGHWDATRVELVSADEGKVFFKISGHDSEDLQSVVVDLEKRVGKKIFIRLVDDQKGGWGHLNFDDFQFYDKRPKLDNERISEQDLVHALPPQDVYQFAGLTPEKAVEAMKLPEGFHAELVAAEPDIVQPIAFAMDARGRLWVAEGNTYPIRAPEGQGKDRIIVLEDEKGDGHFTKRTVFCEGLNLVSGMEVGFGGVWVGAAPYLMFIPTDLNADAPRPSGPPQVLLDGFGYQDTHETLNTFCWGPDGWLYGCHGVFTNSSVGKPGCPPRERVHLNAGIFRYHPTRHVFERFAEGTSNPWGMDFDDHGQIIMEGCVIPHLWHMIQGAHYTRQGGQHDNPYLFDEIKTIADHLHWASNANVNQWAANGHSDALGGGHAHAGLMVYLGGSWPQEYVGQYFMNNIHGARINMDVPEAKGSGFVGHHGKDFILFNDVWSQIVNLRYDQDGSVYMIDWYDKIQCHTTDPNAPDRSNGRIFKIVHGDTKTTLANFAALSDAQLAEQQLDPREWRVRQSRRLLQERAAAGKIDPAAIARLVDILANNPDESRKLRALWTLHCIDALTPELAQRQLRAPQPYVAAWTLQLLCEKGIVSADALSAFAALAHDSPSPVVRLYLASALQRLPEEQRWDVLAGLLSHGEDADDHNLPLMDWWALEPLCGKDPQRALALAAEAKIPRVLSFAVRRIGAGGGDATNALVGVLGKLADQGQQLAVLSGIRDSLQGRRSVPMPAGWSAIEDRLMQSGDGAVRSQALGLAVTFGSQPAIDTTRKILLDARTPAAERLTAMDSLLGIKDAGLAGVLQGLLDDAAIRGAALRGLGAYDDANTPGAILAHYPGLEPPERKDALATLAARPPFARKLVEAIESGVVPSRDVSADIVRQLRTLNDKEIDASVAKTWGVLRESPADKKMRIAQLKALVNAAGKGPDLSHGRLLFSKTCMQCHSLYGTGGHVGPDLTGSNRSDIDYLLENVVDPNAIIPADYRTTQIETTDDRTLLGIVKKEDDKAVTLVMPGQDLLVPKGEIKSRRLSALSMMPEGLLDAFPDADLRDIIAYLRAREQVQMPDEKK